MTTLLIALVLLAPPEAKTLTGKVIKIADGDTLTLLDAKNQQIKIRLNGIDSPEKAQPFGTKSKDALAGKVFGKQISVVWKEKDRYGRTLGDIHIDGRWINKELVAEGWAWHFKRYSSDKELAAAEISARAKKVGLWGDSQPPVAPWEWRARKRRK